MNRNEILKAYGDAIVVDSVKARKLIQKLDYKNDPLLLQRIAQTYLDESRFEVNGDPRDYLFWPKWRMAEKYTIMAFELNPDCLIVLSAMGSLRQSSGQTDIAIYCFERIIELGLKGAKSEGCDLPKDFAKELINDSRFELYRLYYDDDPKKSRKYLALYKKGLEMGANTIYKPLKKFLLD